MQLSQVTRRFALCVPLFLAAAVWLPGFAVAQTKTFSDPAVPVAIVSEPFYTIVDVLNHDRTLTQYATQSISNAGYNCTAAPGLAAQGATPHVFGYDANLFEIGTSSTSSSLVIAPITAPYYNGCAYGPLTTLPSTVTSVLATAGDTNRQRLFVLTSSGGSSPETVIGYDASAFSISSTSALVSYGQANLDTGATYTSIVTDQDGAYGDTAITELRTATTAGNLWIYSTSGRAVKVLAPDGSSLPAISAFIIHNPNDLGGELLVLANQDGLTATNQANPPIDPNPFTIIDLGQLHQLIAASPGVSTVTLPAATKIAATTPYYAMLGAAWNPVNHLLYAVVGGGDSMGNVFRHVLTYNPYTATAPAESQVADVTAIPITPPYYPQVALNAAAGTMQFLTQNPTAAYTVSVSSGASSTATQLGATTFPSDPGFAPTAMTVNPLAGNTWFASSSGKVDVLTLTTGMLPQAYLDMTAPEIVASAGNSTVHVLGYFPFNSDTSLSATNVTVTATKLGGTPYTFGTTTSTATRVNGVDISGNFPAAGIYTLTANFPGDSVQAAFTSSPVVVAVATPPYTTSITLTATAATTTTGTALVTLTGSSWVPTGTLKLYDASTGKVVGTQTLSGTLSNPISIPITFATTTTGVDVFYSGDAQNAGSGSPIAYLTTPPTLTLTLTGTTPSVSTSSTVNGSVKFGSSQTIPPSGFVTISTLPSNSTTPTVVATVPAASAYAGSGIAFTFTAPSTSGTYTVYASYPGDPNYPAVTTANSILAVNAPVALATTTTITAPATTTVSTVFSINIKLASATSTQTPSGTMNITAKLAGSSTSTNIGIINASQAYSTAGNNLTANLTTAGVWTITANFYGDQNFAPSAGTATVTVNPATAVATTLKITAPASVAINTPYTAVVALTAASTLTNGPSGLVTIVLTSPSGTVLSTINTTAASAFLGSGYSASIPAASASGTYTLTASFAGDTNYNASTVTSSVTVSPAVAIATSLTLKTPTSATVGTPYTATVILTPASVSNPSPTGTVTLTSTVNGTTTPVTSFTAAQALSGVSYMVPANASGTVVLTAAYAGDTNYAAASPAINSITVQTIPTSITLTNDKDDGVNAVVTATITLLASATSTPTGSITLTATPVGGGATVTLGTYTASSAFNTPLIVHPPMSTAGDFILTASYPGSTIYGPSSITNGISIIPTATLLSITGPSSTVAQVSTSFSVLMCCVIPNTSPSGNITVSSTIGGAAGPSATIPASNAINGSPASLALTFPSAGTYILTAKYLGDGTYPTLTSTTLTVTVAASATAHFTAVLNDDSQMQLHPSTPSGTRSVLLTAFGGFSTPVNLTYTVLGLTPDEAPDLHVTLTDPVTNLPVTSLTPTTAGTSFQVTVTYTNFKVGAVSSPRNNSLFLAGGILGFSLLGLRRRSRKLLSLLGVCLILVSGAMMTGCDGAGLGTVIVTATPANSTQNGAQQQVSFPLLVNQSH